MKIQIKYSSTPVDSIESLAARYPRREFQSPNRSTVPSLAFWSTPETRIRQICNCLHLTVPSACTLDFEFKVKPIKGRGKASHTDVMITWDDAVIGIEAKYTEPNYQIINKWIQSGKNEANRNDVLDGWCEIISRVTKKKIGAITQSDITYQMVHRLASVCSMQESRRYLVYQLFDPSPDDMKYYLTELQKVHDFFHIDGTVPLYIMETSIKAKAPYDKLVKKWGKGCRACQQEVISGLKNRTLMDCDIRHVEQIKLQLAFL